MTFTQLIRSFFSKQFYPKMRLKIKDAKGNVISDTRIGNTTHIESKENLQLGTHVFIGHYNFLDASNGLTIDEGCQLTNYVSVLTHSSHISIRLYGAQYRRHTNLKGYVKAAVHIGKYSFIGPHTVIMPGTKIGKGCIVSAFSYVKGEFEDFSIIAGNPAKKVGDTRSLDEPYLQENKELRAFYNAWAGNFEDNKG